MSTCLGSRWYGPLARTLTTGCPRPMTSRTSTTWPTCRWRGSSRHTRCTPTRKQRPVPSHDGRSGRSGGQVAGSARALGVAPAATGVALGAAAFLGVRRVLAGLERRERWMATLDGLAARFGEAMERGKEASTYLASNTCKTAAEPGRLEVAVASHLVRSPDRSVTQLVDSLELNGRELGQPSALLRNHPAFEPSSRWGWSVGGIRPNLETSPSDSFEMGR